MPIFPGHPLRGGPEFLFRTRGVVGTVPEVSRVDVNAGTNVGGTAVTITGKNFRYETDGTAPIVLFGTAAATSVVVVSQTSITCVTPAGTADATVDVTVTSGSQSGTLNNAYTYIASTIQSVTPGYGVLAGAVSVVIRGTNFDVSSTVFFGGVAATGVIFLDTQTILATIPSHAIGFVDVTLKVAGVTVATLRNGFQYTLLTRGSDIRRMPGIQIRSVLNSRPNSATFTVDGGSNLPVVGEEIQIVDDQDGDRLLFAGNVQTVDEEFTDQADLVFRITAVDFTWLLNKYRPVGTYTQVSASDIVQDLITKYAPGFNATAYVQSNLAKVSLDLDGSKTMSDALTLIAQAIGGGHWYVDYSMNVHFFHVRTNLDPTGLIPPALVGASMTVAAGAVIPGGEFRYDAGAYMWRHTFVYDDGTETSLRPCSNMLVLDGTKQLTFSSIPLGPVAGARTCVKRRIYMTRLMTAPRGGNFDTIEKFCEITDNTTTTFTCYFGQKTASLINGPGSDIGTASFFSAYGNLSINSTYSYRRTFVDVHGVETDPSDASNSFTTNATLNQSGNVTGFTPAPVGYTDRFYRTRANGATYFMTSGTLSATNGVWGFADHRSDNDLGAQLNVGFTDTNSVPGASSTVIVPIDSALTLPAQAKVATPAGPVASLSPTIVLNSGLNIYQGGSFAFRVAFLYRDGSVSFVSPASGTVSTPIAVSSGVDYFKYTGLPVAPSINGVDCIARLIFEAIDAPSATPSWTDQPQAVVVIPDNTTTQGSFTTLYYPLVLNTTHGVSLAAAGIDTLAGAPWGAVSPAGVVSTNTNPDPIPLWPNDDGPNPEDGLTSPSDINDTETTYLLLDPPFTKNTDASQVRNRVKVRGAGSLVTTAAAVGDTKIYVASVLAFSINGGSVYVAGQVLGYSTTEGVAGLGWIDLTAPVAVAIAEGEPIVNYYQCDDRDSQLALAKVELDWNGNPTDGVHEYTIVDTSLKARFQLFMRGHAELELFGKPIVSIRYATRDPNTRVGATVHVDLSSPACKGDFLIQDVTIDQVHDESDQLNPRYTVTATNVKFALEDLLLQIFGNSNGGSGASSSGLVATALASSSSFDPSLKKVAWAFVEGSTSVFSNDYRTVGFGTMSDNGGGSSAYGLAPDVPQVNGAEDKSWVTLSTAASTNSLRGPIVGAGPGWAPETNFELTCVVRTPVDLTNIMLFVGMFEATIAANNVTLPTNTNVIAIRYSTASDFAEDGAPDRGWVGMTRQKGVASPIPNGLVYIAPIAPSTTYTLKIKTTGGSTPGGLAFSFSADGGANWATIPFGQRTTPYAATLNAAAFGPAISVSTRNSTAKKFSFKRLSLVSD